MASYLANFKIWNFSTKSYGLSSSIDWSSIEKRVSDLETKEIVDWSAEEQITVEVFVHITGVKSGIVHHSTDFTS